MDGFRVCVFHRTLQAIGMSDARDRRLLLMDASHISDAATPAATPRAGRRPEFVPGTLEFKEWLRFGKV